MQELEKILEELKRIKDGNRKEKLYAKYPPNSKDQEVLNAYSQGYEDGTDNFYNVAVEIIRKHMNDGWIPVDERLPEDGMVRKISWEEFRNSGMLWWINMILHTFGLAIVYEMEDGNVTEVYPARVKYRGFSEKNNTDGYKKVSKYVNENASDLLKESRE